MPLIPSQVSVAPTFGGHTIIDLRNATGSMRPALELSSSYTDTTHLHEHSKWSVYVLANGTGTLCVDMDESGIIVPNSTLPALRFGSASTTAGLAYNGSGQLRIWTGGRGHYWTDTGLLLDPGAATVGGLFTDSGQSNGLEYDSNLDGTGVLGVSAKGGGTRWIRMSSNGMALFSGTLPTFQPSGSGEVTGFVSGSGQTVLSGSFFTGNLGTTGYTISDVVKALKQIGALRK